MKTLDFRTTINNTDFKLSIDFDKKEFYITDYGDIGTGEMIDTTLKTIEHIIIQLEIEHFTKISFMQKDILKYDNKLAKENNNIFNITTPQEMANEFNKVVESQGKYYIPQKK